MKPLDERERGLLDGKNLAHVATVYGSGPPRVQRTWVGRGGEHVPLNTQHGRGWPDGLRRDPPVALSFTNADAPTEYPEVVNQVNLSERVPGVPDQPKPGASTR